MTNHSRDKGYTTRQDEMLEDTDDTGYISANDLLKHLVDRLQSGCGTWYRLEKHPNGQVCGMNVFTYQTLDLPGATMPLQNGKQPRFWRRLPNTEADYDRLLTAIEKIDPPYELNKEGSKIWNKLKSSFSFPEDTNTLAYKLSRSCVRLANDIRYKVSLKGKGDRSVYKVCPQVSWFSPELQQLDPLDLLPLLPTPEAKLLMLVLGRVACGASGEAPLEMVDTPFEHGFRSMATIIGKEGQLGKTVLLESVRKVLDLCGYTTAVMPTKGRFSWAAPILADLAFNDDLTVKTQKSLLTHDNIKTVVTGGTITTEEKGVKGLELKARCGIISCSNHFNKLDYLAMDNGEISRANLLYSRNSRELDNLWLDRYPCGGKPVNLMPYLCQKYQCQPETLTAYLIARSAEYFLATIGLGLDYLDRLVRVAPETTRETVDALRAEYTYDTDLTTVRDIVNTTVKALASRLVDFNKKARERICRKLEKGELLFSPGLLAAGIKYSADRGPSKNPLHFTLNGIAPECLAHIHKNNLPTLDDSYGISMDQHFSNICKLLVDKDGIHLPLKQGSYNYLFQEELRNVRHYLKEFLANGDPDGDDYVDQGEPDDQKLDLYKGALGVALAAVISER